MAGIETRELSDADLEKVAGGVANAHQLVVDVEPRTSVSHNESD